MFAFDRLDVIARRFQKEARKCHKAKAHLPACIMQASAMEASLQAMCYLYPKAVAQTPTYQRKRFRRKRDKALELKLRELISIAFETGWLPKGEVSCGGKSMTIAQICDEVRRIRNLVHPGAQVRYRAESAEVSNRTYIGVYAIFAFVVCWLRNKIYQTGMKVMKRAGVYEQVRHIPPHGWFG
jgi:hypothetical protein